MTAAYGGDANFSGSTSSSISLMVNSGPPPAQDFTVAAGNGSLSIAPGQSGTDKISITPKNGFNQATTFACSGLPSEASCNFSPMSVTPNGTAASTSTMTITTTAPTSSSRNIPAWPFGSGGIVAACGLFFLAKRRRMPLLVCLMLLLAIGGVALGCGGGSKSSGSSGGTGNSGTPAGTSNVTVTATAGSISHTAKITLTIQ